MPANLLALLDDIAAVLDDVAVMTKVATKKTAGVLGDDLALNAEQVTGVKPDRELPVVWAVAKGSAINKAILVPAALAISAVAPWAITPLLMIGGAFLCFEGFEKVAHKLLHRDDVAEEEHRKSLADALVAPEADMVAIEKQKIRGAIRTDFVLSAEIVVISLGSVAEASFGVRVAALIAIAVVMTAGVYGLVAAIVKLDDAGVALRARSSPAARALGAGILRAAPWLMKGLSIAGTVAMFLVGGGILTHGIPGFEARVTAIAKSAGWLGGVVPTLANALVGIVAGGVLVAIVAGMRRLTARQSREPRVERRESEP